VRIISIMNHLVLYYDLIKIHVFNKEHHEFQLFSIYSHSFNFFIFSNLNKKLLSFRKFTQA